MKAKARISRYRHHQLADLRWIHHEKQPGNMNSWQKHVSEWPVTPQNTLLNEKQDGNCRGGGQRSRSVALESDPPTDQQAGSCTWNHS